MLQNVAALLLCGCFLLVSEDSVHQLSVSAPQTYKTSLSSTYCALLRTYYCSIIAGWSLMPVLKCCLHGSSVLPVDLFNKAIYAIFKCNNHLRPLSLSYKRPILNQFPSLSGRTQQEMQFKGQRVSESGWPLSICGGGCWQGNHSQRKVRLGELCCIVLE